MSSIPPDCWTQRLMNDGIDVVLRMPRRDLRRRDKNFKWSVMHAICGSNLPIDACARALKSIKKKRLHSLICAKDADGDTPLQSAIRSNSNPEFISLLLEEGPTCRMLMTRNNSGETPLEMAFQMREWGIVRPLLRECIHNHILPELTGVGNEVKGSTTLLHEAICSGDYEYLRIHLQECRKCDISGTQLKNSLQVTDEKNRSPWHYLVFKDLYIVEEVLQILEEYEIDFNDLYTNKVAGTYLLHDAYRRNKVGLIELLESKGADKERKDARGLMPRRRNRNIILNQPHSPSSLGSESQLLAGPHSKHKSRRSKKKPRKDEQESFTNSEPQLPHDSKQKKRRRKRGKRHHKDHHQESASASKSVPVALTPSSYSLDQSDPSVIAKMVPAPTEGLTRLQAPPPPVLIESGRKTSTEPSAKDHAHIFHVAISQEGTDIIASNVGYAIPYGVT